MKRNQDLSILGINEQDYLNKLRLAEYVKHRWFTEEAVDNEAILAFPEAVRGRLYEAIAKGEAALVGLLIIEAVTKYMPHHSEDKTTLGYEVLDYERTPEELQAKAVDDAIEAANYAQKARSAA